MFLHQFYAFSVVVCGGLFIWHRIQRSISTYNNCKRQNSLMIFFFLRSQLAFSSLQILSNVRAILVTLHCNASTFHCHSSHYYNSLVSAVLYSLTILNTLLSFHWNLSHHFGFQSIGFYVFVQNVFLFVILLSVFLFLGFIIY